MRRGVRTFLLLTVLVALSACSSSPSPVLPPVELPPIDHPLPVISRWQATVGYGVYNYYLRLRPVFDDQGIGYGIDYTGFVTAFRARDGKHLWERQLHLPLAGGPSLVEGRLLLGSSQGDVVALDPKDGRLLWQVKVSSEVLAPIHGEQSMLVVRTVDGRVHGLRAEDGKQVWVFERNVPLLTLRGTSAPVVKDGLVIVGNDNGKLAALTLRDGTLLWETTIAEPRGRNELERMVDIDADPVVVDSNIYVATYQERLASVALDSGQLQWVKDFSGFTRLAVDGYRIYATDDQSRIWCFNRFTGETNWRQDKLLRRRLTGVALTGDYLIVADYDGYVHWLRREDGKLMARRRVNELWYMDNPEEQMDREMFPKANNILVTPVPEQGLVIALDRLGNIEAFELRNAQD